MVGRNLRHQPLACRSQGDHDAMRRQAIAPVDDCEGPDRCEAAMAFGEGNEAGEP